MNIGNHVLSRRVEAWVRESVTRDGEEVVRRNSGPNELARWAAAERMGRFRARKGAGLISIDV